MNKQEYKTGLISDALVSITPMEVTFIPPPGMESSVVTTIWSKPFYLGDKKDSKILKVKDWLNSKKTKITIRETDHSYVASLSKYAEKQINKDFYTTVKISGIKTE